MSRPRTFAHALAFVAGFSLLFVLGWGGAATLLGGLFAQYKLWLGRLGGVLVILFGLTLLDVVRVPWLAMDTRPGGAWRPGDSLIQSGLFGLFFAAGWTPCVGTTLGAILTLAMSQDTSGLAMVLASGYALGLGLPFLGLALSLDRGLAVVRRLRGRQRLFQQASGLFLLLIGVLMLSDRITWIAIWAQRNGLFLDLPLGPAAVPTYAASVVAGLLSFLSPCVLPLVPAYLGYLSGQSLAAPVGNPRVDTAGPGGGLSG